MTTPRIPPADWSAVGPRGHAVQFYWTDGHLLDLLTRFVGIALVVGDMALVIATRAHRDGLAKRLRARGFDLNVPRDEGRYIGLDAEATLAKFTRDGRIDRGLFERLIGDVLAGASRRGERQRVVAFGEMVAVLWAAGRHESAIQLEQMWSDVSKAHELSLCCAYPMSGFGNQHAAPFMKICAQHSHVFTVHHGADLGAL